MPMVLRVLVAGWMTMALGCMAEGLGDLDDDIGTETHAVTTTNGVSMNGVSMNGVSMNGVSMNGVSMNGVSMNGVSMNGTSMNGVSMNGVSMNGTDFIGATMKATLDNGTIIDLRIDNITTAPDPTPCPPYLPYCKNINENADVLLYDISYCATKTCTWVLIGRLYVKRCTCTSWAALCPVTDSFGAWNKAIPFQGKWSLSGDNPGGIAGEGGDRADVGSTTTRFTHFTFACRDSSMSKCAERLQYKPWKTVYATMYDTDPDVPPGTIPISLGGNEASQYLNDYHQACVRMLRADYCGDGVAHTQNGTAVEVFDCAKGMTFDGTKCFAGVQKQTTSWGLEAEWGADGAKCLSAARWSLPFSDPAMAGLFVPNAACPSTSVCPNMATYLQRTCPNRASAIVYNTGHACFAPASMTPFAFFGQQRAALATKADNLPDQPGLPW